MFDQEEEVDDVEGRFEAETGRVVSAGLVSWDGREGRAGFGASWERRTLVNDELVGEGSVAARLLHT